MSAVVETSPVVEPTKRAEHPLPHRIDPSVVLLQPWALKAMSIIRVQEAWRVARESIR